MKHALLFSLALAVAPAPVLAQTAPAANTAPSGAPAWGQANPQMAAAMAQSRAQMLQLRQQTRARMLAALTPAHRTLVGNTIAQLALSVNPDPRAAAASLDAVLAPAEKQSIVALDAASRTAARSIIQQQRAAFAATLTADQRAQLDARRAKMEAYRQSHPRSMETPDAGTIVLRTLGNFGGPGMGPERLGDHPGA